jgi:hypothetical protein
LRIQHPAPEVEAPKLIFDDGSDEGFDGVGNGADEGYTVGPFLLRNPRVLKRAICCN